MGQKPFVGPNWLRQSTLSKWFKWSKSRNDPKLSRQIQTQTNSLHLP